MRCWRSFFTVLSALLFLSSLLAFYHYRGKLETVEIHVTVLLQRGGVSDTLTRFMRLANTTPLYIPLLAGFIYVSASQRLGARLLFLNVLARFIKFVVDLLLKEGRPAWMSEEVRNVYVSPRKSTGDWLN